MERALQTLFEQLESEPPSPPTLFLRAEFHPALLQLDRSGLTLAQTYFPRVAQLTNHGLQVAESIGTNYETVLYLGTNQKDENLYNFALGGSVLSARGKMVVAMANDIGAARFEGYLSELFGQVDRATMNHCRVFWATKLDCFNQTLYDQWLDLGQLKQLEHGFYSRSGIFGWNKIDQGSKLLCDSLPPKITGRGADLGAGYGYVAFRLLTDHNPTTLDLYEAEKLALEASRSNIEPLKTEARVEYLWSDVTTGLGQTDYDFIVSNPPFHQGKATVTTLGAKFIETASLSLRSGGSFYMVSNSHLAYRPILTKEFSKVIELNKTPAFVVYQCIK